MLVNRIELTICIMKRYTHELNAFHAHVLLHLAKLNVHLPEFMCCIRKQCFYFFIFRCTRSNPKHAHRVTMLCYSNLHTRNKLICVLVNCLTYTLHKIIVHVCSFDHIICHSSSLSFSFKA